MAIIDDVKLRIRISSAAYDGEVTDLIAECKADLALVGITNSADDSDPLIKRAICTYCKANFGLNNPDTEKLMQSYEMLKAHLSLSAEYIV